MGYKGSYGGDSGTLDVPSDQVFNSNSERDTYFTSNPSKLVEGAQCVVLTSPTEGLYQVYTSGAWENRSAIIQGEKGEPGGVDFASVSPNRVPIVNATGDKFVDSGITETATNIIVNKTLAVPQESVLIGPAVKISDKGGYLGISNIAEGTRGFGVVSKTYETEAQRDLDFADSVPRIDYQYLVPAKWVYQFPFDDIVSDDNMLSFEFEDTDNTFIRKFRIFSTTALTGVRVWIENILPSGDALVWENVTTEDQESGQGATLNASGHTEIETGFIKLSTANIKFRVSIQAMTGEKLKLVGSSLDLGFGTGFYPKMYVYTQDSIKTELLDGIDTAHNRFGEFREALRLDADNVLVRKRQGASDTVLQSDFSVLVPSDRPEILETNGSQPIVINSITVKHQGTWGPVQVSFSDLRTKVVNLVDGDNTITLDGKPLVIEANEDYYIRFTGAIGTGSKSQISLLGNSSGDPYASINTTIIKEKSISDGSQDVIDIDASAGNFLSIDASYSGKFVNIMQSSTGPVSLILQLSSFNDFNIGDVIKFNASDSYENYYFGVFYTDINGANLVSYPSKSLTLTRTATSWDAVVDGPLTNVLLAPASTTTYTGDTISNDTRPVYGFAFAERPGVEYVDDSNGNTLLRVDIGESESRYTDVSNETRQLTKDDQYVRVKSDSSEAKSILPPLSEILDGHFIDFFTSSSGNPQIIESNDALVSAAPVVTDIPVTNISLNGSAIDASPLGQTTTTIGTVSYVSESINGQTHDVMQIAESSTGTNGVSVPVTPVIGGNARTIFFQYRSETVGAEADGHRIFGMGDKGFEGGFIGLTTIYTDSLRIDINGRAFTYNNQGAPLRDGNWHSVAIVISNSTDDPKFYVDDFTEPKRVSTIAGKNIAIDTKSGPITIGTWNDSASNSCPGLYSNFQLYERALSGDDLSNLAIQGLLGATDLTALDIHERVRFIYDAAFNTWQASDATLLRILNYSERISALENPSDSSRYRAVSLVTQTVNNSGSTIIEFEVEKEAVEMSMSNGEQTFIEGGLYTVLINLNADDTSSLEAWIELYNSTSSAWEPIEDTGVFDKGRYAETVTIGSGSKLRIAANSTGGNVTLAPVTLMNGVVAPSATISVAKV